MSRIAGVTLVTGLCLVGGCTTSSPSAPAAPAPPTVDVTGTWGGPTTPAGRPEIWTFVQAGTTVSGSENIAALSPCGFDALRGLIDCLSSQIMGTVAGNTLTFTDAVTAMGNSPLGTAPSAPLTCVSSSMFSMQVAGNTMTGNWFVGGNVCQMIPPGVAPFPGISLGVPNPVTLTRQ